MRRVLYVKRCARRLAEEHGIPYRVALRIEGRRAAGLKVPAIDEARRVVGSTIPAE